MHEDARLGAARPPDFMADYSYALQLMDSIGGQVGQDPNMQAFSGDRRPNMLASIQEYLDKLQEVMQNPSVLLPSLSYPPGHGEHTLHHKFGESTLRKGHCACRPHCCLHVVHNL